MSELSGKNAIVTGAGAGIGREIALALTGAGARVMAADLDQDSAGETAELCGAGALWQRADVTSPGEVDAMFDRALAEMGPLDILINNAGVTHPAVSILDLDLEHLERVFAVDYKGVYLCSRRAGKEMIAAGRGGAVVNISSIAGLTPLPLAVYGPMKAAVNLLTRILARDWAAQGIRVNAVAPGYVLTPLMKGMIERGERDPSLLLKRTPMDTLLEPGEVAAAVLYLVSTGARHVTGAVLPVDAGWLTDGGWSAYPGLGEGS